MRLEDNPFFAQLLSLDLPTEDYAVFGSGPLFVQGLREEIHDIDAIARGEAWKKIQLLGLAESPQNGAGKVVRLFKDNIEFFNQWGPGIWNIDELIDTAKVVEGVRFVTLDNVLKWKKILHRPKDLVDIAKIEEYFKSIY